MVPLGPPDDLRSLGSHWSILSRRTATRFDSTSSNDSLKNHLDLQPHPLTGLLRKVPAAWLPREHRGEFVAPATFDRRSTCLELTRDSWKWVVTVELSSGSAARATRLRVHAFQRDNLNGCVLSLP